MGAVRQLGHQWQQGLGAWRPAAVLAEEGALLTRPAPEDRVLGTTLKLTGEQKPDTRGEKKKVRGPIGYCS
jgi:hypothetical protein